MKNVGISNIYIDNLISNISKSYKGTFPCDNIPIFKNEIQISSSKRYVCQSAKSIGLGNSAPAYYPSTQTKIRTYICVKEISGFTWSNCIRGTIPHQIIVGFVEHDSYVGSNKKNPFAFENFGINQINLKVNDSSYPETPYTPNFNSGDFMELYDDFLRGVGVSELNETIGMSKAEFKNHKMFTIYGKYFRKCIKKYMYCKKMTEFYFCLTVYFCVFFICFIL